MSNGQLRRSRRGQPLGARRVFQNSSPYYGRPKEAFRYRRASYMPEVPPADDPRHRHPRRQPLWRDHPLWICGVESPMAGREAEYAAIMGQSGAARAQRAQRALTRPPPRLPSRHTSRRPGATCIAFRPASRTTSMTRPRGGLQEVVRVVAGWRSACTCVVHHQRTREVSEQASSHFMRSEGIAQPNLLMSHSRTISPATRQSGQPSDGGTKTAQRARDLLHRPQEPPQGPARLALYPFPYLVANSHLKPTRAALPVEGGQEGGATTVHAVSYGPATPHGGRWEPD